ncbi:hypothetical protein T439DRAFT_356675 [Meredithblackwellia eburnea MCA 4105]
MRSSSPDSFVPQSLLDTIQGPTRTYTSSNRPRPSHAHSASSISQSQRDKEREKKEKARDEAAAMSRALGLDSPVLTRGAPSFMDQQTPKAPTSSSSSGASESELVARLRATISDKDSEILLLRKQVSQMAKEKQEAVDQLALSSSGGAGSAGTRLGARELEELEKSFSTQEALLAGYQKDAEKSLIAMEGLKKQNSKLVAIVTKLYGPDWETDLQSHLTRPTGVSLPLPPPLSTPSSNHHYSSFPKMTPPPANSVSPGSPSGPISTGGEALQAQLSQIQSLLRGMEQRIVKRTVELEKMEKDAKMAEGLAVERVRQLEMSRGDGVLV